MLFDKDYIQSFCFVTMDYEIWISVLQQTLLKYLHENVKTYSGGKISAKHHLKQSKVFNNIIIQLEVSYDIFLKPFTVSIDLNICKKIMLLFLNILSKRIYTTYIVKM